MADTSAIRYALEVGGHVLSLEPIDAENYASIVDGDYEAAFPGFRAAHRAAVARADEDTSFSDNERATVRDISNWRRELFDLFDPERD